MIKSGDSLPDVTLKSPTAGDPEDLSTSALFAGKKAVLFAVPGAFTPSCHLNHMPGYLTHLDAIKAKGVDLVACVSVNDVFVMKKWGEDTGALGKITLLADGSAEFTKAMGLELDAGAFGLGVRSQRYAAIVENGVVKEVMVEDAPPKVDASSAESVLAKL